jgi:hypothetical protein
MTIAFCQAVSTGDFNLDIAFSDHRLSRSTLEQLGAVIKAIARRTDDQELRFWSFIHYVSSNHPSILSVTLQPDACEQVESVLSGLSVEPVEVRPPPRLGVWGVLVGVAVVFGIGWFFLRG